MKKFYSILFLMIALCFTANAENYKGKLDIEMLGSSIAKGQDAIIELTENNDGSYKFVLPDFFIMIGEAKLSFGDIVIEKATRQDSNNDGIYEIKGTVEDMELTSGTESIHAKVELDGTETKDGKMNLTVIVEWYPQYPETTGATPINVKFEGQKETSSISESNISATQVYGIENAIVVKGFEGLINIYSISGSIIKTVNVSNGSEIYLNNGVYLIAIGNKVCKVYVK